MDAGIGMGVLGPGPAFRSSRYMMYGAAVWLGVQAGGREYNKKRDVGWTG